MVLAVCGSNDFNHRLKSAGNKLVVADFMAEWCGPCRQIMPKIQSLENKYGNRMCMLKVNVDQCSNLAHHYHVSAMPTFVLFKNGREVDRLSGGDAQQLKEKIIRYT